MPFWHRVQFFTLEIQFKIILFKEIQFKIILFKQIQSEYKKVANVGYICHMMVSGFPKRNVKSYFPVDLKFYHQSQVWGDTQAGVQVSFSTNSRAASVLIMVTLWTVSWPYGRVFYSHET